MVNEQKELIKFDSPMLTFLRNSGIDISEASGDIKAFKLKAEGFMDLAVEFWIEDKILNVSVCHYGLQNGDMMRDPEIVYFVIPETGQVVPASYRNDYLGLDQVAAKIEGGKIFTKPKLKKSLTSFTRTWVSNLKSQGFKLVESTDEL